MRRLVAAGGLLVLLLVLGAPLPASAATINFSALSEPGTAHKWLGPSLTFDGFVFTSSSSASDPGFNVWQANSEHHPLGGDAATSLMEWTASRQTTVSRAGGGEFDLIGIDLANWGVTSTTFPSTFDVTFTGTRSDLSTVTQVFAVSNLPAGTPQLQSFVFSGFTDLLNVTMTQGVYFAGNGFQFNNLRVEHESATPVPEPGSLSLIGGGMAMVLIRRWRARRADGPRRSK